MPLSPDEFESNLSPLILGLLTRNKPIVYHSFLSVLVVALLRHLWSLRLRWLWEYELCIYIIIDAYFKSRTDTSTGMMEPWVERALETLQIMSSMPRKSHTYLDKSEMTYIESQLYGSIISQPCAHSGQFRLLYALLCKEITDSHANSYQAKVRQSSVLMDACFEVLPVIDREMWRCIYIPTDYRERYAWLDATLPPHTDTATTPVRLSECPRRISLVDWFNRYLQSLTDKALPIVKMQCIIAIMVCSKGSFKWPYGGQLRQPYFKDQSLLFVSDSDHAHLYIDTGHERLRVTLGQMPHVVHTISKQITWLASQLFWDQMAKQSFHLDQVINVAEWSQQLTLHMSQFTYQSHQCVEPPLLKSVSATTAAATRAPSTSPFLSMPLATDMLSTADSAAAST
ncbi:MAG TPA: hypothetical protein VM260_05405, partial [Pirellula sp.]|nr:hypothetical protein [Pirellula sp.]